MKESSRLRLVTALRNGVIDIAIVTGEMPLLDSKGMPLWSERTLVALSEDHPLANRDIVYWTDLRSETVLLSHFPSNLTAADFMRTDLPDGLFLTWAVQSTLQKYFNFPATQISSIPTTVSSQTRGVSRSSRTRDGMRWTRQRWACEGIAGRIALRERTPAREDDGAVSLFRLRLSFGATCRVGAWGFGRGHAVSKPWRRRRESAYGEVVWS
jgi:hypothetical protein